MGIHNGQGLGIYDGGKLTAIISDGGGSQVEMVGSEWLTRIPILLQIVTIFLKKSLTLIQKRCYIYIDERDEKKQKKEFYEF